jgi:hypothetical protein
MTVLWTPSDSGCWHAVREDSQENALRARRLDCYCGFLQWLNPFDPPPKERAKLPARSKICKKCSRLSP